MAERQLSGRTGYWPGWCRSNSPPTHHKSVSCALTRSWSATSAGKTGENHLSGVAVSSIECFWLWAGFWLRLLARLVLLVATGNWWLLCCLRAIWHISGRLVIDPYHLARQGTGGRWQGRQGRTKISAFGRFVATLAGHYASGPGENVVIEQGPAIRVAQVTG